MVFYTWNKHDIFEKAQALLADDAKRYHLAKAGVSYMQQSKYLPIHMAKRILDIFKSCAFL